MKKQIVTGLIGAASLLAMAASGAYAFPTCASGKITAIEAGYHNEITWTKGPCSRMLSMTCSDTSGDLAGKSGVYCVHNSVDPDGILATALTAASDGKNVGYQLYTDDTTGIYGDDGLVLSLTLLP